MMMFGFLPLLLLFFLVYWISGAVQRGMRGGRVPAAASGTLAPRQEADVFRLAARRGGTLTLSDVVLGTGLGLKEAERFMDQMVDGVRVRMEINPRGAIVYEFPEIVSRLAAEKSAPPDEAV
jgi:hypothetical protein